LVNPKILLLAGSPAVKAILKTDEPITKIRGKWIKLPGKEITVMPIFHPSYLLRNPSKNVGAPKWQTWQDMQEIKHALEFHKKARDIIKSECPKSEQ
jgi:DNA polymerase